MMTCSCTLQFSSNIIFADYKNTGNNLPVIISCWKDFNTYSITAVQVQSFKFCSTKRQFRDSVVKGYLLITMQRKAILIGDNVSGRCGYFSVSVYILFLVIVVHCKCTNSVSCRLKITIAKNQLKSKSCMSQHYTFTFFSN